MFKPLCLLAPKELHRPDIIDVSMLQNINSSIVGPNLEATKPNAVPLVEDLFDLAGSPSGLLWREAQRPLVGLVPGIAFDFEEETHSGLRGAVTDFNLHPPEDNRSNGQDAPGEIGRA